MRTVHSIRNISIGLLSQIVIIIIGFVSRKVFLDSLGVNYLGINGLLTNVLSVLMLVESGVAVGIVYNLYKPLAENDQIKIISLIQLYKKAYGFLACLTLVIGLCLYPLLDNLMKDSKQIPYLIIIYLIFIAKNIVSYLNAHKWSLINADQRGYLVEKWNMVFQIITISTRIAVLVITKNYVFYLTIELGIFTLQNIFNGRIVNKRYPYIKTKTKYPLDKETKDNIKQNVKALFLHSIGGFIVTGTDNVLISSMVGIVTVGLYSNYTMISDQMAAFVRPFIGGIGASVGNLIATEDVDKNYFIFNITFLINFWVYSLCFIFLYNLFQPFISWWLGSEYLINKLAFELILVNFYLGNMRSCIATFKTKAGIFVQDKYAPLFEGAINLIASIFFAKFLGLAGILLGTTISTLATVFWTQPYFVYKYLFRKNVWAYFKKYIYFASLTVITCFVTTIICDFLIAKESLLSLIEKGFICLIVPNIIFTLTLYKTNEFRYLMNIINTLLRAGLLKINSMSNAKV